MAATAAGEGRATHVRDEANVRALRFSKGIPLDDSGGGGRSGMEVSDGWAAYTVASRARGEAESASGHVGRAASVARGGGKAGEEAAGATRRSSPRLGGRSLGEEILGDNNVQVQRGVPAGRKRKVAVTRTNLQPAGVEIQNEIGEDQPMSVEDAKRIYKENENLKLQLALKTKELEREENQRLKLELALKEKEIESLQKQHEELKAENENLKKTAKPPKSKRLCRFCQKYDFHDYRNCPEKRRAASSSEEEEDSA
ncbi:hypothetical protein ACP70R_031169 [Stipagrostis hirtigluma subsp. patula]